MRMEIEIEKLYTEAVPNRRGKMSIKNLEITFRKIGIAMTVQQIRTLFFHYDRTKSKKLDLDEFRQLIEDIIQNPALSLALQNPFCCNDLNRRKRDYPIKILRSDVIRVDTKHAHGLSLIHI